METVAGMGSELQDCSFYTKLYVQENLISPFLLFRVVSQQKSDSKNEALKCKTIATLLYAAPCMEHI